MNKLNNIFEHTHCVSEEMLVKYLSGTLSTIEKHEIEKHLIDCEMCSDAMEGLRIFSDPKKYFSVTSELNRLIQQKFRKEKETKIIFLKQYRTQLAIAASIILVLGFVWFFREAVLTRELNRSEAEQLFAEKFDPPPAEKDEKIRNSFHFSTEQNQEDETKGEPSKDPSQIAVNKKAVSPKSVSENKFIVPEANVPITEEGTNVPMEEELVNYPKNNNSEVIKRTETVLNEESHFEPFHANKSEALGKKIAVKKPANARMQKDEDKVTRGGSETETSGYVFEQKTKESFGKKRSKTQRSISDDYSDYKTTLPISSTVNTRESHNTLNLDSANAFSPMSTAIASGGSTSADSGMIKYEHKDYAGAVAAFEKVLEQNPTDEKAIFYGAVSYLSIGQSDKAIAYFNKILANKNSKYYDDAQWYSSLAYIKKNNLKNARSNLIQIRNNEKSRYRKQADEVLRQIK